MKLAYWTTNVKREAESYVVFFSWHQVLRILAGQGGGNPGFGSCSLAVLVTGIPQYFMHLLIDSYLSVQKTQAVR